ncbi:MAG TPA: type II toxin-antitoxin system HicA family toxin [Stellaceae bacterium]|nr:type II toxin-antitoxin system HicA family toxin [Stellaceae bacterium]
MSRAIFFSQREWPAGHESRPSIRAPIRAGWTIKRQRGSHRTLSRPGWPDYIFAFHDNEKLGPRMLARIAKLTGLRPHDLWPPPTRTKWTPAVRARTGVRALPD